jgi:adenylate cyclase
VLFSEPDRMSPHRIGAGMPGVDTTMLLDTDVLFAEALGRAPSIVGFADAAGTGTMPAAPKAGIAISGTDPTSAVPLLRGAAMPLPQYVEAAAGLGTLSLNVDELATVVRRVPLLWSDGKQFFPTLSLEALRVALGAANIVVLGETGAPYVEGVRVGDYTIPTMSEGDLWLYYRPPANDLYVSAKDVLGADYDQLRPRLEGTIVFVGTSASGLLDIHGTTLGDSVPGVSIHANALEQVLTETYLLRADWVSGLEIVVFAVIAVVLIFIVLSLGPLAGLVAGLLAMGGFGAFSWLAFRGLDAGSPLQGVLGWLGAERSLGAGGLMIDPSFPIVGLLFLYAVLVFFQFAITDADKRQVRRAFGFYVSPTLLTEIERNADRLKLGGEMRELTVLFSDVRGFTPLSEQLTPTRIVTLLNVLFSALGRRIVEQRGTIDKFIGDAIMAFWNAPVDVPGHARRACIAALGMRDELKALNERDAFAIRNAGLDREEIHVGVGIATGEALVGNMGLDTRFDYSCIGDTVNTASRVEGACKPVGYDIVVTADTRAAAADLAFLPAGAITLKGKALPVPIHLLVGDDRLAKSPQFEALAREHDLALAALQQGQDIREHVATCITLAASLEPGLKHFYEILPERRADFAAPLMDQPAAITVSA